MQGAVSFLAPYLFLVSRRAAATDEMQALTRTHAPDLFRGVELLAAVTLAALGVAARRRLVRWRDRGVVFAAALSLSVLAVFNQQIATGLSLQPMHYEQYVSNYVALLSFSLACALIRQGRARRADQLRARADSLVDERRVDDRRGDRALVPHKLWIPISLFALAWAACDAGEATRYYALQNAKHDDWRAVVRRLDELACAGSQTGSRPVVFNPDDFRVDQIPAESRCAVVWAPHTFSYSGLTRAENELRVFQFLHFAGVAPRDFAAGGRDQGFLQFSVFGWERANPRLAVNFRPVTAGEIAAKQQEYSDYVSALDSSARPPRPVINFVVVSDDQPFDLSNLERLYTLELVERLGAHAIYRATPKRP